MSKFVSGLLILLMLGACTPAVEEPENLDFPDPSGPVVSDPITPHTVWRNPIFESNPSITIDEQRSVVGLVFDGWVDESVEKRINDAIQAQIDAFMAMTTPQKLPPLRGLYQRLEPTATLDQQYINAYTSYSINGVISVIINAQFEFKNPDDTMVYFYLSEGLTFECINGNRLNLSDLMVNGVDIALRLNQGVTDVLDTLSAFESTSPGGWFFEEVTLIQPFKGLRPTQSFSLNSEGIQLILDHRTPEFDISTYTKTLTIPYALIIPDLALTQRYADPSVFINPIKRWQLFQTQDQRTSSEQFTVRVSNKDIQLHGTYPKHMESALLQRHNEQKSRLTEILQTQVNGLSDFGIDGGLYTYRAGPYTCINVSYYVYHTGENLADSWVICYDEYGEVMTLSDVFTPGFDVEAYFRQRIREEVTQSGYYRPGFDLDEAMANLQVTIQLEGLSVSTSAKAPGFTTAEYVYLFIDYGSIGIENLAILHPTP